VGSFLCQTPGQKSLSHSSWSSPPLPPHLRETQARRQREMRRSRRSIPAGRGNASKVVLLPTPRVTVPELFIAFAGPRGIPLTVPKFKCCEDEKNPPRDPAGSAFLVRMQPYVRRMLPRSALVTDCSLGRIPLGMMVRCFACEGRRCWPFAPPLRSAFPLRAFIRRFCCSAIPHDKINN
jgi:hypothetical protein